MPRSPSDRRQHLDAVRQLIRAERTIERAVLDTIDDWLEATRYAILAEAAQAFGLQAAAYPDTTRAVDAASQGYDVWRTSMTNRILPAVSVAFGEAYNQVRLSAEFSAYRFEQEYMATVGDRLKIWPAGAFEELRPELLEALAESESFDEIRDRVGAVLGIDARTRDLRGRIDEIDKMLADPDVDKNAARVLRATRRDLWREHDESLGEWRWKARRIARTEAQGATQGGKLAAARAAETATGQKYHKRWISTDDQRVRLSHLVSNGQTVPLAERFRVGGFLLDHPGDPSGIAPQETINCRCALLIYTPNLLQDALQGPDGSIGEITPGGVRIGPDDPDDADKVITDLADERDREAQSVGRRGEDHGQEPPGEPEPVELTDDRDQPVPDLSGVDDDELLRILTEAHDGRDHDLYDWADAEWERRAAARDGEDVYYPTDGGDNDGPPPPGGPTLTPSPDDDDEPIGGPDRSDAETAMAVLDAEYEDVVAAFDDEQRSVIEQWQRDDRTYEAYQAAARNESNDAAMMIQADILDELIDRHTLQQPVQAYRGIRDSRKVFGVTSTELADLIGRSVPLTGFFGTSVVRDVAIDEFTKPSLGGGAALIEVLLPAGTRALWVSLAGVDDMRYQGELLLPSFVELTVESVDETGPIPIVRASISPL